MNAPARRIEQPAAKPAQPEPRCFMVVVDGLPTRVARRTAIMVEQLLKRAVEIEAIADGDVEIRFNRSGGVTCSAPRAYGSCINALDSGR